MIDIIVTEDDGRTTRFNQVMDLAFYMIGLEQRKILNIRFAGQSSSQIDLYRIRNIQFLPKLEK